MLAWAYHGSVSIAGTRACSLSRVRLFAILSTVARWAPLSVGFSRHKDWSGLPFPPPENLPDPGIKPTSLESPSLQADSLPTEPLGRHCGQEYTNVRCVEMWTCLRAFALAPHCLECSFQWCVRLTSSLSWLCEAFSAILLQIAAPHSPSNPAYRPALVSP